MRKIAKKCFWNCILHFGVKKINESYNHLRLNREWKSQIIQLNHMHNRINRNCASISIIFQSRSSNKIKVRRHFLKEPVLSNQRTCPIWMNAPKLLNCKHIESSIKPQKIICRNFFIVNFLTFCLLFSKLINDNNRNTLRISRYKIKRRFW